MSDHYFEERLLKLEAVAKAARALDTKLDEVEVATRGVFVMAYVHGMEYRGPTYAEERGDLQRALQEAGL